MKIITTPLRLLAIGLALAAAVGCADKGKLREPTELADFQSTVEVDRSWSSSIGDGADGRPSGLKPALEADGLFVAELGGRVAALDPATGRARWENATKARVISGPSVIGNIVVVGTLDAEVLAFSRADGKLLWRSKASSEVLAAPSGEGDIVVARSIDGRIYGLSAADGSRLWSFDRTEPNLTLRGLSSPMVDGNRVFIGMDNGRIIAVNIANGEPVWEQPVSTPNGRTELERLTDIDANLLGTPYGVLVASYGGDVALVEPGDGEARWKRSIRSDAGMAVGKGNVYVSDADGVVWALDAESGAAAWKNESLKFRGLSPPAFFGGYVVVADYKGYVHFLKASDGTQAARIRAGSEPVSSPMVASETALFIQNVDGRITALTLKNK